METIVTCDGCIREDRGEASRYERGGWMHTENEGCRRSARASVTANPVDMTRRDIGDQIAATDGAKALAALRKSRPLFSGCLAYFPDALLAVAEVSRIGNEQHNPGAPVHWDRSKSGDEADALARHLLQRGTLDADGVRHSAKVAWRALAMLQKEIEADRA